MTTVPECKLERKPSGYQAHTFPLPHMSKAGTSLSLHCAVPDQNPFRADLSSAGLQRGLQGILYPLSGTEVHL